jgi:hypothetical protein
MPAVIPFIPLIAAAVGVGGAAYSANKARQQQSDAMKKQAAYAGQITPGANQFLQQGQGAIGQGLNYYASMLNNPRESTAPEQNRISSMYAGQANNVRNQYPRGGFGPAAAGNLRNQERSSQESVIQNGRPMAAGALSNLGMGAAGLGYQGYGLGSGILGNVFNQGLAAREQQFNQGSQLGSGLFNAYQGYLLSRSLTGPGNSGAGSPDTGGFIPGSFSGQGYAGGGSGSSNTSGFGQFGSGQASLYGGNTLPNSGSSGHP